MKNSWIMWILIVGLFIGVLVVLNYQGTNRTIPLSEILKEDKSRPNDIEYEFITNNAQTNQVTQPTTAGVANVAQTKAASVVSTTELPSKVNSAANTAINAATTTIAQPISSKEMKKVPFTIQVFSFQDKTKADKIIEELTKKGYAPSIVSMDLGDKGTWYRIYVGKYDTKAQAEEVLAKIKADYKSSFIIAPKAIK